MYHMYIYTFIKTNFNSTYIEYQVLAMNEAFRLGEEMQTVDEASSMSMLLRVSLFTLPWA